MNATCARSSERSWQLGAPKNVRGAGHSSSSPCSSSIMCSFRPVPAQAFTERGPGATRGTVATMLGFLWTLPNTLVGLVLGLLTFQRPHILGGAIVFDRAPRGLTCELARFRPAAMTVGQVGLSARPLQGPLPLHQPVL